MNSLVRGKSFVFTHISSKFIRMGEIQRISEPAALGELIREKRVEIGVTQSALALAAGTGLNFVYQLENGKTTCEFEKVFAVLHALGLELCIR